MFYIVKSVYAGGTEYDNVDSEGEANALATRNKKRGAKVEVTLNKGTKPTAAQRERDSQSKIKRLAADVVKGTKVEINSVDDGWGGWSTKGEGFTRKDDESSFGPANYFGAQAAQDLKAERDAEKAASLAANKV